jgi:NAD(P)-dependent dehydrogenase (short-subunit alcohol dehydrogenase family)
MKNLNGKVAIVTGASRGLGKDIAIGLAEYGAAVVIAARTDTEKDGLPGTIYKTMEQIQAKGGKGLAFKVDVSNEESVQQMTQKTLAEFGRIDILVNNAGVAVYMPVVDMPLKRWDLTMRVNLYGTFICSKAVLPSMIKQGGGSIINITTHGHRTIEPGKNSNAPYPTLAAYEAAKGGVERFTMALAGELSKNNIAVNCIKPEYGVATEGMRLWFPDRDWSGWASSDAMVKATVFLAIQDASGVNGTIITAEELAELHAGAFPWH